MTGGFCSSLIPTLHVESNVLALDFCRELLALKALPHPNLLPSSSLWSLLASEDLANSSWKFALSIHPRLLDAGIIELNYLEFKFMGTPPWTFPCVCICLFLLKLVKVSHSPLSSIVLL